jgi:hypothetical protein
VHRAPAERKPIPRYALLGAAIMAVSQTGMLRHVEPFWSWHTCIAWTGYLLFVDGLVWSRRGSSWLRSARGEFLFLAAVSFPLWLVFEFFNLFIRNWHYINLPESAWLRNFGYAWAFATIWPAIFETGELVASFRSRGRHEPRPRAAPALEGRGEPPLSPLEWTSMAAGAAMLLWPLIWPSPYLAAPVWLGFIFLLDPLNRVRGDESLIRDFRAGSGDRAINLAIAGLICGFVWEFWNYWARTKWIYTVPIFPDLKIFEMPLPGYGGFPVFALECFAMYVFVRRLLWRGPSRAISL